MAKLLCAGLALNLGNVILTSAEDGDLEEKDAALLAADDECNDPEQCSTKLLQLKATKASMEIEGEANEQGTDQDPQTGMNGGGWSGSSSGAPAPPPGFVPKGDPNAPPPSNCAALSDPTNNVCKPVVDWLMSGGKHDPNAGKWFSEMPNIAGVDYMSATADDFQRLYYCSPPGGKSCGAPPCHCTLPPCGNCYGGHADRVKRPGCTDSSTSMECKPPRQAFDYNGQKWPTYTFEGGQTMHIFAIGDWGGMDGTLNPIEGRPPLIAYAKGSKKGPSVFPRSRMYPRNPAMNCKHDPLIKCFENEGGPQCPYGCGYVKGVDDQAQLLVAQAMKDRARISDPQYILNVGDNFYWGGIEKNCGTPMDSISFTAHHQFDQIFEGVYSGKGLDGKPWLSVLGNHDWGGRVFNNGWDQQIAYTWASPRWVMPAAYWRTTVEYPTQMFSVDLWFLDTNFQDAHPNDKDPDHNICGPNNPAGATCASAGGPTDKDSCPEWFHKLWDDQKTWLIETMAESTATWQIAVTHFPCGQDGANQAFYRKLRRDYGLDLLVTGHRHDQELWLPNDSRNWMGGLTCFVTGGGGGITSEASPDPMRKGDWYGEAEYGFFDITIGKYSMTIESINYDGKVMKTAQVYPFSGSQSKAPAAGAPSAAPSGAPAPPPGW
eukprot:CAMPEP_0206548644 /NCGR_PEP_ID=MMETSP0325_2-20121206/14001_1 /ASSEMBLY_ACC=CAM_ASM_000347 /TAXON_ID=2866 /ORGANISM="Crypthecodinium cohnii, Strain Seligo" /LENGTH=658 /DNA_ID=CAMNT_0054048153 /DNA_START=100 /DNA_END=2077 /DNA_ORIENTATION=-